MKPASLTTCSLHKYYFHHVALVSLDSSLLGGIIGQGLLLPVGQYVSIQCDSFINTESMELKLGESFFIRKDEDLLQRTSQVLI